MNSNKVSSGLRAAIVRRWQAVSVSSRAFWAVVAILAGAVLGPLAATGATALASTLGSGQS